VAKELFITKELSQDMLLAGEALIKHLEEKSSKVQAAFWLLDAEKEIWMLIIASPIVAKTGARDYYKRINEINEKSDSIEKNIISLHNIEVVDNDNRFVKALLHVRDSCLWNDKYWINTRLGENFLDNIYFEDMYIYRMN